MPCLVEAEGAGDTADDLSVLAVEREIESGVAAVAPDVDGADAGEAAEEEAALVVGGFLGNLVAGRHVEVELGKRDLAKTLEFSTAE